jgi:O-antigen ligase
LPETSAPLDLPAPLLSGLRARITPSVGTAGLSLAIFVVALQALAVLLGYEVARDYIKALQLTAGVAIVAGSLRWPRQALLMAIPATLLAADLIGTSGQLLIVTALTIGCLVELLARRASLYLLQHGLLAALGAWLVLAYFVDGVHVESQLSAEHDLATLLVGLWLCAMAISIAPTRGELLAVGSLSAAAVSVAALLDPTLSVAGRFALLGLNPNYVGAALSLGAVASLAALIHNRRNPIWIASGAACLIGVRASGSRGALVMLLAGAAVLALLGRPRWVQLTAALVAALLIALPGFSDGALNLFIGPRTATDFASSNLDRANAGLTALRYAAENPVFGVGYGQFAALAARDPRIAEYVATHNDYLRLAAESGFPAALLLLAIIALALRNRGQPIHRAEIAMVITYAVGLLFGNFLSNLAVSAPFWLWLGWSLHPSAERSTVGTESAADALISGHGARLRSAELTTR